MKMLAKSSFLAVLALGTLAPAVGGAAIIEADANNCEIYVDDFFEAYTGVYGSSGQAIGAILQVPSDAVKAGMVVYFDETFQRYTYENGARQLVEEKVTEGATKFIEGRRLENNQGQARFEVEFQESYDSQGREISTRTLRNFAFFVEFSSPSGDTYRFWLKDKGGADFLAADYDRANYYYSNGVFNGGYTTRYYLWQDSGSSLFDARNTCF